MLESLENIGKLENIFDETNNFRQQLEDIFHLNPDYSTIKQKLSEISSWVTSANTTNDFSIKSTLFYAISYLTNEFIKKYQDFISIKLRDQLIFFADSAIARGKINQAVQTILGNNQTDLEGNTVVGIEKLCIASIILAEVVDNYWSNLSKELYERLKETVIGFLAIESKAEFKGNGNQINFEAKKQILRNKASYILRKIEQFEKKETERELEKYSNQVKQPRPFALCAGEFIVPDDFNEPLPEEILNQFEGE